jgi:hypothetical protein
MAKGQQKSNREAKKPKQAKAKPSAAAALPSRAETPAKPAPARKK